MLSVRGQRVGRRLSACITCVHSANAASHKLRAHGGKHRGVLQAAVSWSWQSCVVESYMVILHVEQDIRCFKRSPALSSGLSSTFCTRTQYARLSRADSTASAILPTTDSVGPTIPRCCCCIGPAVTATESACHMLRLSSLYHVWLCGQHPVPIVDWEIRPAICKSSSRLLPVGPSGTLALPQQAPAAYLTPDTQCLCSQVHLA